LIGLGEKYTIFTKTNQNSENFLPVLVSIVPVSYRANKAGYNQHKDLVGLGKFS